MRIIEREVYIFDELTSEAQTKAIEHFRHIQVDDDWWWYVYDYAKDTLELEGFEDVEINFSGFWSQGDGASFTCNMNLQKFINAYYTDGREKTRLLKLCEHDMLGTCNIVRHNRRYSHENSCSVEIESYGYLLDEELEALEERINDVRISLCRKIYHMLEQEYESLTSDESIQESIECNEYEFCQDGTFYSDCH